MLPARNRLKKDKDFRKVCRQGKPVFFDNMSLRYLANNLSNARIGISISKASFKKATERNKVKRLIREAIKSYLSLIKPGFDIVIIAKNNRAFVGKEFFSRIKEKIAEAFKKSNLLN